jgi:hypothetical protein
VAKLRGGILVAQELDRHAKDMVGLVPYAFFPLPRLPHEALCIFVHGWIASSALLIYFSPTTEGSRFEVVPPPEVRPMCCIPSLMSGHDFSPSYSPNHTPLSFGIWRSRHLDRAVADMAPRTILHSQWRCFQ